MAKDPMTYGTPAAELEARAVQVRHLEDWPTVTVLELPNGDTIELEGVELELGAAVTLVMYVGQSFK